MGRGAGFLYFVRRLRVGAVAFVLTVAAGSVFAAGEYIPAGQPIPQGIRWTNTTATGVNTGAWARVGTTTSKFPVPVSSGTLGGLFRGAMRRVIPGVAWYQLAKSLIDGAGWAINELQNQVVQPPTGSEAPAGTVMWCASVASALRCTTTLTGARQIAELQFVRCITAVFQSGGGYADGTIRVTCREGNDIMSLARQIMTAPTFNWGTGTSEPTVISDYELGQLLKAHPQIINAILIDPDTGAPIRTAELIEALNALAAAYAAANGLPPPNPLTADPDFGEGQTPSQTEWPGFCDWATTVCEFIDWVRAEPEQDTPPEDPWEEEAQIPEQEWSSGLGGGSCPGPISFNVSIATYSQNVEFPYTPLCEGAGWIRPIAIALCGLLGVFIVGGYRRSANA